MGGKIKARKYLTCSACRKYVVYQSDLTACRKCGSKYDLDADLSTWKGSTWFKGGSDASSPTKAANKDGKTANKGAGKGAKAMTEGTVAKGCTGSTASMSPT